MWAPGPPQKIGRQARFATWQACITVCFILQLTSQQAHAQQLHGRWLGGTDGGPLLLVLSPYMSQVLAEPFHEQVASPDAA